MKLKFPVRAKIADQYVTRGITYLEIHQRDGGYYLFQFENLELPPKWDSFTDNIDELLHECKKTWGIEEHQWMKV